MARGIIFATFILMHLGLGLGRRIVAESRRVDIEVNGSYPHSEFTVAHYNILSKEYGMNTEPWFLYPLDLSDERRSQIQFQYDIKVDGSWPYIFENGFGGLLTEREMEQVRFRNVDFEWQRRETNILETVQGLRADILSLVELDVFDTVRASLEGYGSAFVKRPRRWSADGSGLFWRQARFAQVSPPLELAFVDPALDGVSSSLDRVMVAVALRDLQDGRADPTNKYEGGRVLVAASMHLMRNPEDDDKDPRRMLQVSQMMNELVVFVAEQDAVGLVLLGDFNALPNSWTHVFMEQGWLECPQSNKMMLDAFDGFRQQNAGACTQRTNIRNMWIDYAFFSSATLELVDAEVAACPVGPIPDATHPSDHLPVKATFRFRADSASIGHCFASNLGVGALLELGSAF